MARQIIRTSAVNLQIAELIRSNGSKFFGVTFVTKEGKERTLCARVFKDKNHTGENNAAHFQKYVLVVAHGKDENGKRKFRNVNLETIKRLTIGGRVISFE